MPGMRTSGGIVAARGDRWGDRVCHHALGTLPPVNLLMGFVPQIAFFLAHLLFGLVVGIVVAVAFRRRGVAGALPASR
jgi:hypothetical protein